MESLWNSPNKVDLIRLVSQWVAAISTIIALVFSMRSSKLKSLADAVIKNEVNKAHDRISNFMVEVDSEEAEKQAFESGSKMVIRTDLLNKQNTRK